MKVFTNGFGVLFDDLGLPGGNRDTDIIATTGRLSSFASARVGLRWLQRYRVTLAVASRSVIRGKKKTQKCVSCGRVNDPQHGGNPGRYLGGALYPSYLFFSGRSLDVLPLMFPFMSESHLRCVCSTNFRWDIDLDIINSSREISFERNCNRVPNVILLSESSLVSFALLATRWNYGVSVVIIA